MHSKLPHINLNEYYQFITFRTNDSIDSFVSKIQENHNFTNKNKQYQIDKYLDYSSNGAYLIDEKIDIFKDIVLQRDNIMYEVDAIEIMPNHVHLLIKQKDDLSKTMKYIKAKSTIELNKSLRRSGKFWQSDYFDKVIRDEKLYSLVYEYILNNPVKVGVEDAKRRVYSKY